MNFGKCEVDFINVLRVPVTWRSASGGYCRSHRDYGTQFLLIQSESAAADIRHPQPKMGAIRKFFNLCSLEYPLQKKKKKSAMGYQA